MSQRIIVCFILFLGIFQQGKATAFEIFVNQHSSQEEQDGNSALSFVSLETAITKAYQLRKMDMDCSISIFVAKGDYILSQPLILDARLNGLRIVGTSSSEVTIKGSRPLKLKWKKYKGSVFVTKVVPSVDFDQLVVNGEMQILARYPNYNEEATYWQGYAADAIALERIATWAHPEGAIFNALHGGRWGGFHYQVTGVDASGEAILQGGQQNNRPSRAHKEFRMIENVFEELDAPGEWYLDNVKHKLYYYPTPEVDLSNAQCEGVVLKSLVELRGTEASPVKDITIEGLTFTHTKRTIFETYEPLLRSDWSIYRGAALFIEGAEHCKIENCEFSDLGGNVIFVSGYNTTIEINSNHIHDCGASAICFVGEASAVRSPAFQYGKYVPLEEMDTVWGPKTNAYPHNCVAHDNLIYRIGRLEKQTAGVEIAMAMNITVSHNTIYDVPRSGINIGDGTWGGHLLEYNEVFNTVLETSDHGAFNSWGRDRFWHPNRQLMDELTTNDPTMPYWDATFTTVIRNNRFRCDHGWDIDLDDGSSNYHIYNNVCLNGGIKLREGFGRTVENNIMINNALHPHVWFAKSEDVVRRNIVFAGHKDVRVDGWGKEIDYNLFPNELALMKAQIYGIDAHSTFGDPLFVAPATMDYTVTPHSPALALGFINIPMDDFGVVSPRLKAMSKTPQIPVIKKDIEGQDGLSPTVEWLRVNIKSVDSKEEQSAYGLNTTEGVIVTKIGAHSPVGASGVKRGDVIVSVQGETIRDVKHFLSFLKEHNDLSTLDAVLMRNQTEMPLLIKLN